MGWGVPGVSEMSQVEALWMIRGSSALEGWREPCRWQEEGWGCWRGDREVRVGQRNGEVMGSSVLLLEWPPHRL